MSKFIVASQYLKAQHPIAVRTLRDTLALCLSEHEQAILSAIERSACPVCTATLVSDTGIPATTLAKVLNRLHDMRLVQREGRLPTLWSARISLVVL
jgi:uncharacterized membrane protein